MSFGGGLDDTALAVVLGVGGVLVIAVPAFDPLHAVSAGVTSAMYRTNERNRSRVIREVYTRASMRTLAALALMCVACGSEDTSAGVAPADTSSVDTSVEPDTASPDTPSETLDDAPTDDTSETAAPGCPLHSELCGKTCVDTTLDPLLCGKCTGAPKCALGSMCASGVCACQPGLTDCAGTCVDTKGSPDACGGCGATFKCAANKRCRAGACVNVTGTTCPTDRPTECAASDGRKGCFDTLRDPMHCGGCGVENRCAADYMCIEGACTKYIVGVGCTTCPCISCDSLSGSARCCPAPAGSAPERVICINTSRCPVYLP